MKKHKKIPALVLTLTFIMLLSSCSCTSPYGEGAVSGKRTSKKETTALSEPTSEMHQTSEEITDAESTTLAISHVEMCFPEDGIFRTDMLHVSFGPYGHTHEEFEKLAENVMERVFFPNGCVKAERCYMTKAPQCFILTFPETTTEEELIAIVERIAANEGMWGIDFFEPGRSEYFHAALSGGTSDGSEQWALDFINAEAAWEACSSTGDIVKVA